MSRVVEKVNYGEDEKPPDIFKAAYENDIYELARALDVGQRLTDRRKDLSGMTPVHVACLSSSNAFLAACVWHNSFDPWLRDDNLRTPFDHASARCNIRAQELLIRTMETMALRQPS